MTARAARRYPDLMLFPQHEELLAASGIAPHVAAARGYMTADTKTRLKQLGFSESQRIVPALILPVHSVASREIVFHQARPDEPRRDSRGRPVKYETPRGRPMAMDCNPLACGWLRDPSRPLFITEGIRKADAAVSRGLCCLALLGVWNFRGRNELGGLMALADWESVVLKGRTVYIVFDSDVMEKPEVHQALARLKAFLESRGARILLIYLPPGDGGVKVGLDDFLAADHTPEDLLTLSTPELRRPPADNNRDEEDEYRETPAGLVWLKRTAEGESQVTLTNFPARIAAERVIDDGAESRREFEVEACVGGQAVFVPVAAEDFASLDWVLSRLGSRAIVSAGPRMRDRARAAIQVVSGPVPIRRVFAHTGWRELGGEWVYLHAAGAIGPTGAVTDVEVRFPDALRKFRLPAPPQGDELRAAIRESARLLDVAPDAVTVPILAALYRAALGPADFTLHLAGESGAGKSSLAALAQQHFGAAMDREHLPAHWSGTANANEALAFVAKDALLVVDDLPPAESVRDAERLHRGADRLLRAQGDRAGRQRMRADTTLRPVFWPRGVILSTGEQVPRGQSLRARLLIVELSKDRPGTPHEKGVRWKALTDCQRNATDGMYARAMAGFIQWAASRHDLLCGQLAGEVQALHGALPPGAHRRTAGIIANLAAGLEALLLFAVAVGALSRGEADRLWLRAWDALLVVAGIQESRQTESDPVERFLALLRSTFTSGRAHVAGADGSSQPEADPEAWGWREDGGRLKPQGPRLGWLEGDDLYLDPEASHAAAQRLAMEQGATLTIDRYTLGKQLQDRGLLTGQDAEHVTVQRTFQGTRRRLWHLHLSGYNPSPSSAKPGQPGQASETQVNQGVPPDPADPVLFRSSWAKAIFGLEDAAGSRAQKGPETASKEPDPVKDRGLPGQRQPLSDKGPSESDLADPVLLMRETSIPERNGMPSEASGEAPPASCGGCRGTRFWRGAGPRWTCATCHPPAAPELAMEWCDLSAQGAGS